MIRQHPETGARHLDRLWWGLIPYWTKEPSPKLKPINATAERVASAPMFRAAYAKRRCLVPVDSFFEWTKAQGQRAPSSPMPSPWPTASRSRWAASGRAGAIPETDEIVRTFCVITTGANELLADIHDRMPVILAPESFDRWLSPVEPDPRDLLVPYPAAPMTLWPVSSASTSPSTTMRRSSSARPMSLGRKPELTRSRK